MMAHFAVLDLMHEVALKEDGDLDEVSFVYAVRVVRRKPPDFVSADRQTNRKPHQYARPKFRAQWGGFWP